MNKILIKHLGWQLYLSWIASEKGGPTFYMFGSCEVWLLIHTLRTLVLSSFFIANDLDNMILTNFDHDEWSPSAPPLPLPSTPSPPSIQKKKKKREAGVTNKAQAMTCYRYFRVS